MVPFKRHTAAPVPVHLHWTYTKIAPGSQLFGWIAGPCIPVKTHWFNGASKPCWVELLEGQKFCPYCDPERGLLEKAKKPRYTGYTPLISGEGKRCVISVSETIGPVIEKLTARTQVTFSRSTGSRDPLRVRVHTTLEAKRCPETINPLNGYDISEWLVKLWADDELTALLAQKEAASSSNSTVEGKLEHNTDSQTVLPSVTPVPPPGPAIEGIRTGLHEYVRQLSDKMDPKPDKTNGKPKYRKK